MNAVAAVVLAFSISAGPDQASVQGNWYGMGIHQKCSLGLGEDGVILVLGGEVFEFLDGKTTYRIGEAEELDFICKGAVVPCRYMTSKGEFLALVIPSPETKVRPTESMREMMAKWYEQTKLIQDRKKRGDDINEIIAATPKWYWRIILFSRTPPKPR